MEMKIKWFALAAIFLIMLLMVIAGLFSEFPYLSTLALIIGLG